MSWVGNFKIIPFISLMKNIPSFCMFGLYEYFGQIENEKGGVGTDGEFWAGFFFSLFLKKKKNRVFMLYNL